MSAPRILLVEDHWLVAMHAQSLLEELGCVVLGPMATLAEAEAAASTEAMDAAILDVFLGDEQCFPVVGRLAERGIPICLATGCAPPMLPDGFQAYPRLEKPYAREQMIAVLGALGLTCGGPGVSRPEADCDRAWATNG